MFYFDLYIINVYVILPPDLGPFAVNTYIHTYISETDLSTLLTNRNSANYVMGKENRPTEYEMKSLNGGTQWWNM
jgi:hypothetical protein